MLCEHKYIVLFRGDDSDFTGNQEIIVELMSKNFDFTGCKAHFSFLDFKQDFAEIPTDRKLRIAFSSQETKKFPLGAADAKVWLEDANGKIRTVANRIHVVVTQSVKEAYDNDDPQAITVVINGGGCSWEDIRKPLSEEDVFDMECSDWQLRKVCARLWTELGGKVINND